MNSRLTMRAGATGKKLPAVRFFAWLCLCALAAVPARAAFEDLGAGARGPGMGNAMAAVADDVYAAHYNPAGLGVMTRAQFTAAYTQLFSGLTDDSKLGTSFFGYAHPVDEGRLGTFAGALNSFSLDGGLYRENTLYLSYGRLAYIRPGGGELFLGGTLKYLSSSFGSFPESANATNGIINTGRADPLLSGNSSHRALDADVGALYRFRTHYQLGLQVAHLPRPNMAFSSSDSDPLPLDVKLGLDYKSLISNLAAQVETKKAPDGSTDSIFTAAAERWFPKALAGDFGVRGAIAAGTRDYKQLNVGLSYRTRRVQVDYGYALPLGAVNGTSGSHRMAITFHFGKATDQEETLEMLMETLSGLKMKAGTAVNVERSTVTVFIATELSEDERALADKLARAEEAITAGRYGEAVTLASAAADMDPGSAAAWQDMGTAYLGLGNYGDSLAAWEKAYGNEKSPALKEAIRDYMKSIARLARSGAAAALRGGPRAAQRAVLSRSEIENLMNRGVDLYVNREFDKAREIFERVLDSDPGNVEALKALRRLKEEKGK